MGAIVGKIRDHYRSGERHEENNEDDGQVIQEDVNVIPGYDDAEADLEALPANRPFGQTHFFFNRRSDEFNGEKESRLKKNKRPSRTSKFWDSPFARCSPDLHFISVSTYADLVRAIFTFKKRTAKYKSKSRTMTNKGLLKRLFSQNPEKEDGKDNKENEGAKPEVSVCPPQRRFDTSLDRKNIQEKRGVPLIESLPMFIIPIKNKSLRIWLKFSGCNVKRRALNRYPEARHLVRNCRFLQITFLIHPAFKDKLKLMLEESHGNLKRGGRLYKNKRHMYPRKIFLNGPQSPFVLVIGMDFFLLLHPPRHLSPSPELNQEDVPLASGTFRRRLDSNSKVVLKYDALLYECNDDVTDDGSVSVTDGGDDRNIAGDNHEFDNLNNVNQTTVNFPTRDEVKHNIHIDNRFREFLKEIEQLDLLNM